MIPRRLPSDPLIMLRTAGDEPVPEGTEERLAARLAATWASAPVAAPGGRATGADVADRTSGMAAAARAGRSLLSAWTAPLLVLGAAAGAIGHAAFGPAKTITVYVERPASSPAPPPTAPPSPSQAPSVGDPPPREPPIATPESAAKHRVRPDLSRERDLLDRARANIAEGEPLRASRLLEEHVRRFPRGTLIEEREAMAVNVLVALGRYEEARKHGAAFRERFPSSIVLPSVEAALAAIPEP